MINLKLLSTSLFMLLLTMSECSSANEHKLIPNYNILMLPCHVGNSHKKSLFPTAEYLSQFGGHNVTILSTFYTNPPDPTSAKVTMLDLEVTTDFPEMMDQFVHGNSTGDALNAWKVVESRNIDILHLYVMVNDVCKRTMEQHTRLFKAILDTPWDVIMIDTSMAPCAYVILDIVSASRPVTKLLISTLNPWSHTQRHLGIPAIISDTYSWLPNYNYGNFKHRMKQFFYFNLIDYGFSSYLSYGMQATLYDSNWGVILDPYFQTIRNQKFSMWEFDQNSSLAFYQYFDEFGVYRSHLQTEIPIADLKCFQDETFETLPEEYSNFVMDEKSKGTIVFALGHYVNWDGIPSHIPMAFYSAFLNFPEYRFIWQYLGNLALFPDRKSLVNTTNILIVDWLPQRQLLQLNSTRLLISQLGIKSAMEVVCSAMPILALPTWAEQSLTARLLTNHHRAGLLLDRNLITTEYVTNAISDVLANENQHKAQLNRLRAQIIDKIIKPKALALFWINYSVRNRDRIQILTVRGRKLGFIKYYGLDVVVALWTCIVLLVKMIAILLRKLYLKL